MKRLTDDNHSIKTRTLNRNIMIIDHKKIEPVVIDGFKGGKGPMESRNYYDGQVRINMATLHPGDYAGYHKHEGTCEVIYVVSGTLTFTYDGQEETCSAGQVHYCPEGHYHGFANKSDEDATFLCVVPAMK